MTLSQMTFSEEQISGFGDHSSIHDHRTDNFSKFGFAPKFTAERLGFQIYTRAPLLLQ